MRRTVTLLTGLLCLLLCPASTQAEAPKPFYAGVYLYDYQIAAAAESLGEDYFDFLAQHLQILQSHGVNVLHLSISKPAEFDRHLQLVERYGMKLLPQLDFVYFNPAETDAAQENRARQAAAFLQAHVDNPLVLAWSIKEEVAPKDVERLATYYRQILEHVPTTKFFTLHNALPAAHSQPAPDPVISGTDRYAFWWEFSGGGYLASPAFALNWTRTQADIYYEESAKRGADFMLVTTQGGMLMPRWANTLIKTPREIAYPTTVDEQLAMQKKVATFAKEGRMGWQKFSTPEGDFYDVWKYYRAPQNCMKAMAWIGVLEGARLYLTWHYEPVGHPDRQFSIEAAAASDRHEIQFFTLAGRPGEDNPQLKEFGEATREIRAYENIITQMTKVAENPVQLSELHTHSKAFRFPGVSGQVIVIQNSNVGTWPADSRYMFRETDPIRIDDAGNLVGYTPYTEARRVTFSVSGKSPEDGVYDLKSGTLLSDSEGYAVHILPGSGTLLYIGTEADAKKMAALVK